MKVFRSVPPLLALALILGSYRGYLALYASGSAQPRQVYPLPVAALPQADQQALSTGMILDSEAALAQLLEDYLS